MNNICIYVNYANVAFLPMETMREILNNQTGLYSNM